MYLRPYLRHTMPSHPFAQIGAMLLQHFPIILFKSQVTHLSAVVLHVIKLFTIVSFIIQHIFITRSTQSPTTGNTFVEGGFYDHIRLVCLFWVGTLNQGFKRNAIQTSGQRNVCPVAYGSKEVNTCIDELRHLFSGILLSG